MTEFCKISKENLSHINNCEKGGDTTNRLKIWKKS